MADMQFNNEQQFSSSFQDASNKPKLIKWLINSHIVKTESQALYLLVILSIVIASIAIYIYVNTGGSDDIRAKMIQEQIKINNTSEIQN